MISLLWRNQNDKGLQRDKSKPAPYVRCISAYVQKGKSMPYWTNYVSVNVAQEPEKLSI